MNNSGNKMFLIMDRYEHIYRKNQWLYLRRILIKLKFFKYVVIDFLKYH